MIALSTSTVPNDPQFLAGPLTSSLLVQAANPGHDARGAENATIGGNRPRHRRHCCYALCRECSGYNTS